MKKLRNLKKSKNHRILHFIFWRRFDDERIIYYEWLYGPLKIVENNSNDAPTVIKTSKNHSPDQNHTARSQTDLLHKLP